MALSFQTDQFWRAKMGLLGRATGRGLAGEKVFADPEEVLGHVYMALRRRRPDGQVEGENPEAYVNATIFAEARKCFKNELSPYRKLAGVAILPIRAVMGSEPIQPDLAAGDVVKHELREEIRFILDRLSVSDRELMERRTG